MLIKYHSLKTDFFPRWYVRFAYRSVSDIEQHFRSVDSKNGTFTSPEYPHPYAADITVRYIFEGVAGERVQIIFTDLDLHYAVDENSMSAE
jgi:hypothetical protein